MNCKNMKYYIYKLVNLPIYQNILIVYGITTTRITINFILKNVHNINKWL